MASFDLSQLAQIMKYGSFIAAHQAEIASVVAAMQTVLTLVAEAKAAGLLG